MGMEGSSVGVAQWTEAGAAVEVLMDADRGREWSLVVFSGPHRECAV